MERRRLVVRGRVQGVFFRASTQQEARRLGLTGWVANRPDGAVVIEAEGRPDDVAALVRWAHVGPPRATVTSVDASELEPVGGTGLEVL